MTFDEYEVMHERCEMFKINAIKAICQILEGVHYKDALPEQSYFCSIRDDIFNYHIHFINGYNLEGAMMKSTLQLAMNENIEEARKEYIAEQNR